MSKPLPPPPPHDEITLSLVWALKLMLMSLDEEKRARKREKQKRGKWKTKSKTQSRKLWAATRQKEQETCVGQSLSWSPVLSLTAPCTGREYIHVVLGRPSHGDFPDNLETIIADNHSRYPERDQETWHHSTRIQVQSQAQW